MKKQNFRIRLNPAEPFEPDVFDKAVQIIPELLQSQKLSSEEAAYCITLLYASDLFDRATPEQPLLLETDEASAMLHAALRGYIGNMMSGEFPPETALEIARKMLSSYIFLWAWNRYLEIADEEKFTMRMHLEAGVDPETGAYGLTVQNIILTDWTNPDITYTFEAMTCARECMNFVVPMECAEDEEEDLTEEGADVFPQIFFACQINEGGFTEAIMRGMYAPFPERYYAWADSYEAQLSAGEAACAEQAEAG